MSRAEGISIPVSGRDSKFVIMKYFGTVPNRRNANGPVVSWQETERQTLFHTHLRGECLGESDGHIPLMAG